MLRGGRSGNTLRSANPSTLLSFGRAASTKSSSVILASSSSSSSFHSSTGLRKEQKKREIEPEILNHWMNRWNPPEYIEETYIPRKHPEIRRRWSLRDGPYPGLEYWNPWALDVVEEDFHEESKHGEDLRVYLRKMFVEGTVNPIDEPDPDAPEFIIPKGCDLREGVKPPKDTASYRELGNPPVDPEFWK